MSKTIEIPSEQWFDYLQALNRRTGGQSVRIEVENMELGDQQMTQTLPLQEVAFEKKGSGSPAIEIRVGFDRGNDSRELTHWVKDPTRIYVKQDDEGNPECIEIETKDGGKTLLWSSQLPELPAGAEEPQLGAT